MTISRSGRGRRALGVALVVLALGLALTALRGSSATAHASAAAGKVTIADFTFRPGTLRVGVGSRVTFTNASDVTHTATRKSFDTGRIKPGTSASVTFRQKGVFPYHCMIHPFMHGKIIVE